MPSQSLDFGWKFNIVFGLIDSDVHDVGSPTLRPEPEIRSAIAQGGVGLGNFRKLYETLGIGVAETKLPRRRLKREKQEEDQAAQRFIDRENVLRMLSTLGHHQHRPIVVLDESELRTLDDALLPTSLLEVIPAPLVPVNASDAETQDGPTAVAQPGLTKKRRRKAHRQAEQALKDRGQSVPKAITNSSSEENLEVTIETPTKPSRAPNVGAKIKLASPSPAADAFQAPQTTSTTPRAVLSRRSRSRSAAALSTPQPQPMLPSRGGVQFTTVGTPAPFQHPLAPQYLFHLQPPQVTTSVSHGLVPRNVRPVTLSRHSHPAIVQQRMLAIPRPIPPPGPLAYDISNMPRCISIRPEQDRKKLFHENLHHQFPDERKWLVSPRQLANENTGTEGIHIFVDASNILIGFTAMLQKFGLQRYDMSFDNLALLMERGRPVQKRVICGSHNDYNPNAHVTRLGESSRAAGYDYLSQHQVYKSREESKKKKFFRDAERLGWQKATRRLHESESDSETGAATSKTPSAPKWVEQGVDELLHLKMCQSLLDTELPSTMVLATGDGAEAEMSDGFLAHVERALRKRWKVELITWRLQTNGGYKRRAFRRKWGDRFTITELDGFLEDLIDTP